MVRLCFSRKNKTLRAIFNNKHVLELMEKNYRTFCALNSVTPAASEQVKEVVLKILEQTQLSDKRSTKLEQDDFLKSDAYNHNESRRVCAVLCAVICVLRSLPCSQFLLVLPSLCVQTPRRFQSSRLPFQHGSRHR